MRQGGVLQELGWNISPAQQLTLRIWAQASERELPPTLTQSRSEATQGDASLRSALHWKRSGRRSTLQARAAFFAEKIDYRDPLSISALSRFHTWFAEGEGQWSLGRHSVLHGGLTGSFTRAFSPNYEGAQAQARAAAFASLRRHWRRWRLQLDARQEQSEGQLTPFIPALGAEFSPISALIFRARLARNYRLPTLNDLHWQPGGNPALLPEEGWSQELGGKAKATLGRCSLEYSASVFHRSIKNWMLWSLRTGQPFYSVSNIAKVRSRGLEQRLRLDFQSKNWSGWGEAAYDFIRSTNEIAIENPRIAEGEQLWYTPLHQASAGAGLRRKGLSLSYRHHWTGPVTTLGDDLPGYRLGSLRAQLSGQGGRWNGHLFLEVENLWDANYQVIERRAMPGRAWRLGLRLGGKSW